MARFREDVAIRPIGVSTGAAQGLTSLASRLDQFASQQAQVASQKIAQDAAQAQVSGRESFDPSVPLGEQRQDVPFLFGQEQQAFNKGLRAAYVAGVDNENRVKVARIAQENPDNLLAFNDSVESYRKTVLENVDPTARGVISESLDNQITSSRIQVQGSTIRRQKKEIADALEANFSSALESSERMARNGDNESAALELTNAFATIDEMDISEDQKKELRRDAERSVTEQSILNGIDIDFDSNGPQSALNKLDDLSDNVPKGWAVDEWDSFIAETQTDINRKIARQAKKGKQDLEAIKLDQSVKRGLLFTDPAIPADPAKSSQDRKDVNNYYESVQDEWSALPVNEQAELNIRFVENTGVMPDRVISNVNAAMRSGTPDQVALMSDVISRVQETSPASIKDIPQESRAISLQVSDAVKAGIDPEVALENARKATFGLTSAERETIRSQSQAASKGLNSSLQEFADLDVSEGGFDTGIFSRVPDVPPAMLGEYRKSFDGFMQMTGGNVEQAQKLAYQSTQSTWGVTETGGPKRFMKYAPEAVYGNPSSNNDWIENQFNEEMEEAGHIGAIIAIDHSVAREDRPSYPILVIDENTGLQKPLLDDNNRPLRWRPELKQTDQYKAVVGEPGVKIGKAKKQRKNNLVRRANEIRRGVQSRVFSSNPMPFNERAEFLESEEGKAKLSSIIESMNSSGKIDDLEASEAFKGFGVN